MIGICFAWVWEKNQLMYIDKREIEKAEEWKNIFSEPVHLLGR